jgi:hypothetical protein
MMSRSEMDTRDPPVGADNDQRANPTCRQQLDGGRKIRGRFNGGDVITLAIKNRRDKSW